MKAFQIACTLERETPLARAMLRRLQWVASGGFSWSVLRTTSATTSWVKERDEAREKTADVESRWASEKVDSALRSAFEKSGAGREHEADFLLLARGLFDLDEKGEHVNDHAYFDRIAQQMKHGGYEAMLHDLLTFDLTKFNIRAKPDTLGLQRQKQYSMDAESRWVLHLLRSGLPESAQHNGSADVAYPGDRDDGKRHGLFTHARRSVPELREVSDVRLADVLEEWGVARKRYPDGTRYRFPSLASMRAAFDAKWGKQEWPGGIDAAWGWTDEAEPEYPAETPF